jgi:predicted TIM-barrel fold metal-dependent hydrolase
VDRIERPFIDFHTHLFPTRLFRAIWDYFEAQLWPVRYQGETNELVEILLASGVERFVFSTYAHKPGIARELNRWSATIAQRHPRAIPFGSFHPLDDVDGLAREAFDDLGLAGFKVHCQVQRCNPDDPGLLPAYRAAERRGKICLIHCGPAPEPSPYTDARRLERVLRRFPDLPVVVAHLGADAFERYFDLAAIYDNLYLDTTMVFAGFLPWEPRIGGLIEHQDRILYGSDFPNLPYELTDGLRGLLALELGPGIEDKILYSNAARLLNLGPPPRHGRPGPVSGPRPGQP